MKVTKVPITVRDLVVHLKKRSEISQFSRNTSSTSRWMHSTTHPNLLRWKRISCGLNSPMVSLIWTKTVATTTDNSGWCDSLCPFKTSIKKKVSQISWPHRIITNHHVIGCFLLSWNRWNFPLSDRIIREGTIPVKLQSQVNHWSLSTAIIMNVSNTTRRVVSFNIQSRNVYIV